MPSKYWLIVTRDNARIDIRITNQETGLPEVMKEYGTLQAAMNAMTWLTDEQIEKHGAHVVEIVPS